MSRKSHDFAEVWASDSKPLDFDVAVAKDDTCKHARALEQWIEKELNPRAENKTRKSINQCKLYLQNKYFQLRERLPQRHRSIGGTGRGHRCVFAVYQEAFERFDTIERWLEPEPIEDVVKVPVPVQQKPKLLADDLDLGEIVADPEFGDYSTSRDKER